MMKILGLLAIAGAAGTLLRFGCIRLTENLLPDFPWGTLAVNVIGAFCAGMCWVLCRKWWPQYEVFFPVVFAGFFGAFTTFSTFALESARFLNEGAYGKFWFNVLCQNGAGLAAAWTGMALTSLWVK